LRISTRGRYALRALADLTANSRGEPVSIREIAERQGISPDYLEQLFHKLLKAGLVRSHRGLKGGYLLSRPPEEITARSVLEVCEGPLSPVFCVDRKGRPLCPRAGECLTHPLWRELGNRMADFLDHVTLRDLAARNLVPE